MEITDLNELVDKALRLALVLRKVEAERPLPGLAALPEDKQRLVWFVYGYLLHAIGDVPVDQLDVLIHSINVGFTGGDNP